MRPGRGQGSPRVPEVHVAAVCTISGRVGQLIRYSVQCTTHVLILDSMMKVRGHARYESVFQVVLTLLYITWAKSKREKVKVMKKRRGLKYEYNRDNAATELDAMEPKVFESAWKSVAHLHKT